jgi:hypothetical protein
MLPAEALLYIVVRRRCKERFAVQLGKKRCVRWAARLGMLALVVNALVPIHLAFDLVEAVGSANSHGTHAHAHSAEWSVLAQLTGHSEPDGKSHKHGNAHPTPCAVCGALSALAGFAPAAVAAIPMPLRVVLPVALPAITREPAEAPVAYRSRAPPVA